MTKEREDLLREAEEFLIMASNNAILIQQILGLAARKFTEAEEETVSQEVDDCRSTQEYINNKALDYLRTPQTPIMNQV